MRENTVGIFSFMALRSLLFPSFPQILSGNSACVCHNKWIMLRLLPNNFAMLEKHSSFYLLKRNKICSFYYKLVLPSPGASIKEKMAFCLPNSFSYIWLYFCKIFYQNLFSFLFVMCFTLLCLVCLLVLYYFITFFYFSKETNLIFYDAQNDFIFLKYLL